MAISAVNALSGVADEISKKAVVSKPQKSTVAVKKDVKSSRTYESGKETEAESESEREVKLENERKRFESLLAEVNEKLKPVHKKCEYTVHEETNRIAVKVIDEETKEVIREIPPEEKLDMIAKVWEIAGLMFDETF